MGSFVSIALLAAFVAKELHTRDPLVDLPPLKDRLFTVGNFARGADEFTSLRVFLPCRTFCRFSLATLRWLWGCF
jgi:hypothetical protein